MTSLLAGFVLIPAMSTQAAAAETCRGESATIVGPGDGRIDGTAGNDVIVTNGALVVFSQGGDDVICTTGSRAITVVAGPGIDVVDRRGDLDPAADSEVFHAETFVGGAARDFVVLPTTGELSVSTGAAEDIVVAGGGGEGHFGEVRLGGGDDVFASTYDNTPPPPMAEFEGDSVAPTGSLEVAGGRGSDLFDFGIADRVSWTIDVGSGRLRREGRTEIQFRQFEVHRADTWAADRERQLSVVGGDRDDTVEVFDPQYLRSAKMSGGNDVLLLGHLNHAEGVRPPVVRGGRGRDELEVGFRGERALITVDLAREAYWRGKTRLGRFSGFEDAAVEADTVVLRGTDGPNRLTSGGCVRGFAYGGGGQDVIRVAPEPRGNFCAGVGELRAYGGTGRDRLHGGSRDDYLDGGADHDTANGAGGVDTCMASEVRRSCERR